MKRLIHLKVNGEPYEVAIHPHRTLAEVLREELDLIGTKEACKQGDCGSCTVIMDGKTVTSCLTLAVEAEGVRVLHPRHGYVRHCIVGTKSQSNRG